MGDYSAYFVMAGGPPSNSAANLHWRKKKKQKDHWFAMVRAELGSNIPPDPLKHARVTITRHSNKPLDGDNLHHGAKYILDALTKCGVIEDDKHHVIGMPNVRWMQFRHPGVRTSVCVTECRPDELDSSAWIYEGGEG